MPKLIQIVYISRSTFVPTESFKGIEPNVARILAKSRINNRRNGLVGALYFGDGCFFQCLEGEEAVIDALYAKLQADPRHKSIKLLSRKPVQTQSFPDWTMKYVPVDQQVSRLLLSYGMQTFDPYSFSEEITAKFMLLLRGATDPTWREHSAEADRESSKVQSRPSNRLAHIAIGLSVISLILSASALVLAFR